MSGHDWEGYVKDSAACGVFWWVCKNCSAREPHKSHSVLFHIPPDKNELISDTLTIVDGHMTGVNCAVYAELVAKSVMES